MVNLTLSQFDYNLPSDRIAHIPAEPRDSSKLLAVNTAVDGGILNGVTHNKFADILAFLNEGDVLVVNSSRVIPARILFEVNGAKKEVFVLKDLGNFTFKCMVRPGKFFKLGKIIEIFEGVTVEVLEIFEDGARLLKCNKNILEHGTVPLPPYIHNDNMDFERYQTVYSDLLGSVAAPTAGLHFTDELLEKLTAKGVTVEHVMLHVGRGTFLPVSAEKIDDHVMHSEFYELSVDVAKRLNTAKSEGRRVVAVGTTSVRVLESCFEFDTGFVAGTGDTDIFIYPGKYKWKAVDALITNFHLPKSTLLMLVSSFIENKGSESPISDLFKLYSLAIDEEYRFYSFGDSMFIF